MILINDLIVNLIILREWFGIIILSQLLIIAFASVKTKGGLFFTLMLTFPVLLERLHTKLCTLFILRLMTLFVIALAIKDSSRGCQYIRCPILNIVVRGYLRLLLWNKSWFEFVLSNHEFTRTLVVLNQHLSVVPYCLVYNVWGLIWVSYFVP